MIEIILPRLGMQIVSGTIVEWFKQAGDRIEKSEALYSVSSVVGTVSFYSPCKGIIVELLANAGETVDVGAVIARIEEE